MWIYVGKILDKNNSQKQFIFVNSENGCERIVTKQSIHKFCTDNEVVNLRVDRNKNLSGKNMYLDMVPSYKEFPDGTIMQVGGTSKEQVISICMPIINRKLSEEYNKLAKEIRDKDEKIVYLITKLKCISDLLEFSLQMKDNTNVEDILSGVSRYTKQLDIDNAEYKLEDVIRKYGVPGIVRAVNDKLDRLHKRAIEQHIEKDSLERFGIQNTISGLVSMLRNKNRELEQKHKYTKEIIKDNKKLEEQNKEIISEDEDTSDMIEIKDEIYIIADDADTSDMIAVDTESEECIISENADTSDMIEIEQEPEYDMTYREYLATMNKLVKEYRYKFNTNHDNIVIHSYLGNSKQRVFLLWTNKDAPELSHIKVRYAYKGGIYEIKDEPEPQQFIEYLYNTEVIKLNNTIIQKNIKHKANMEHQYSMYKSSLDNIRNQLNSSKLNSNKHVFSELKEQLCDLYFRYIDNTDIVNYRNEYEELGLFPLNLLLLIEEQLTSMLDDTPLHNYDNITIMCNRGLEYSNQASVDNFEIATNYAIDVFKEVFSDYDGILPECFVTIVNRACNHFIEDNCLNGIALCKRWRFGDETESVMIDIITSFTDTIMSLSTEFNYSVSNTSSTLTTVQYSRLKNDEKLCIEQIKKCEDTLREMNKYGLELTVADYKNKLFEEAAELFDFG